MIRYCDITPIEVLAFVFTDRESLSRRSDRLPIISDDANVVEVFYRLSARFNVFIFPLHEVACFFSSRADERGCVLYHEWFYHNSILSVQRDDL